MSRIRADVGDWLMMGPPVGEGTLAQKGIQLTGSVHTHDEMICRDEGIGLETGCAHTPHFELIPLQQRIDEAEDGQIIMAIFRWAKWMDLSEEETLLAYRSYQKAIQIQVKLLAALKIPYDKKAITSHARNWIRRKLGYIKWLGPVTKHVEYKVFCTESCFTVSEGAGIRARGMAGNQPLVAPVHAERLYFDGHLELVEDYGLLQHLKKPNSQDA